jgi:hypothetical protein
MNDYTSIAARKLVDWDALRQKVRDGQPVPGPEDTIVDVLEAQMRWTAQSLDLYMIAVGTTMKALEDQ